MTHPSSSNAVLASGLRVSDLNRGRKHSESASAKEGTLSSVKKLNDPRFTISGWCELCRGDEHVDGFDDMTKAGKVLPFHTEFVSQRFIGRPKSEETDSKPQVSAFEQTK